MMPVFSQIRRHVRVVLSVVIVLGVAPAYLHPYRLIPGGVSEVPTILPRDMIIVNQAAYHLKLPYSNMALCHTGALKRGDMVLITLPDCQGVAPKRIMGTPGDTIELKDNRLIINNRAVSAKALNRSEFAWVPEEARLGSVVENEDGHWITYTPGRGKYRNYPPIRLASDQYFVLGDNRDESADSRVWGPIWEGAVVGKVIVKFPTGPRR